MHNRATANMQGAIKLHLIVLIVGCLFIIGCKKENQPYARIQLYLKDSPAAFDSLLVRIFSIELISDSLQYSEKITLKSQQPINILKYTNERDTLLAELFYNAPTIERIIITFGSSHVIYRKGKSIPVLLNDTVHSFSLHKPIALKNAGKNKLYVDFDCHFSIKKHDNRWKFAPAVHFRSADSTGSVRGKIRTSGQMPFVWLVSLQDTLSTLPLANGNFHILYVPPGRYSLWVLVTDDGEEAVPVMFIEKVEVEASKVTGVGTLTIN